MEIKVVNDKISLSEISQMAKDGFGDMVKAVVDVEKQIMAVGGGMHSDAEQVLLQEGSRQESLWGINLYPEQEPSRLVEFQSLINIRPRENNRTMEIQDERVKQKISEIVTKLVAL